MVLVQQEFNMEFIHENNLSPVLPEGVKNYLIDIDGTITEDVPNEDFLRLASVYPYEGSV